MSYVGGPFRHDIFVSYSHGVDGEGNSFLRDWSKVFVDQLRRELHFGPEYQKIQLFFDGDPQPGRGVDRMAPLTPQLADEIAHSALLLVLMTPHYLASRWCTTEREQWMAAQSDPDLATPQRVPVGAEPRKRIVAARVLPTQPPWPAPLVDAAGEPLVGFFLHPPGVQPGDPGVRPLGYVDLPNAGSDLKRALLEMIVPICDRLKSMKERIDAAQQVKAEAEKLGAAGGQTVYLHARPEHKAAWEERGRALFDRGYLVLPGEPEEPPGNDMKRIQIARDRRVEVLSECDAMLLLGADDGRALDADLLSVAKQDRNSARARSNRLLPCALLNTAGPALQTAQRCRAAKVLQTDWLDGTQPDWPDGVGHWLASKGAQSLGVG